MTNLEPMLRLLFLSYYYFLQIDEYDDNADCGVLDDCIENEAPLHVLPLYSLLPSEKQANVR